MPTYRRIKLQDVGPMSELALSAIPADARLSVNRDKVLHMTSFFALHHYDHFQLAAFEGDKPVAGIAALVQEMPFHDRCEAMVVFCFSTVAGAGFRLLRELVAWFNDDLRLRRLSWAMNVGYDHRLRAIATRRLGFAAEHPTFTLHKG